MKHSINTKRLLISLVGSIIFLMLLLTPIIPKSVFASTPIPVQNTNTTVAVVLANQIVKPGDTFDVTVQITTDTLTRAAQCGLTFDPNLVEITSIDEGTFYKKWAEANGASTIIVPQPAPDNQKGIVPLTSVSVFGAEKQGTKGEGSFLIFHARVKTGANGVAPFNLTDVVVTDIGLNDKGRTQKLGGVKIQNAILTIGSGSAQVQPTPQPMLDASPSPAFVATVVKRSPVSTNDNSANYLWLVIPVIGAVVVGGVIFVTTRKK